jgi:dipeptidyl aminopeptidase/acylaminoacyl peptidase
MRRPAVLLSCLLLVSAPLLAQGRRPITQDDYDRWRTAQAPTLAPTGAWAAWTEVPQVGDGDLVVRETRGTREVRVPRGFLGRPIVNLTAGTDSPFVAPPPQFTPDGGALVAIGYAPMAEYERARMAKPRALAVPRSSLLIVPLTGATALQPVVVPRVRSVRVPRDAGRVIVYLLEQDTATARAAGDTIARRTADTVAVRRPRTREFGTTLVIRHTDTGAEDRITDVTSYAVDPTGAWVAYTIGSRTPDRDGAVLRAVAGGAETRLMQGTGNYKAITFDRDGRQVAFVSDKDEFTAEKPRYAAYHAMVGRAAVARRVVAPDAFTASRATLSDRTLSFSRDGSTLVLGAAPVPPDSIPADSLADRAQVDVWHYMETRLQPQQKVEAARDRNRTWLVAHRLSANVTRLIGGDTIARTILSDDGSVALALSDRPYALGRLWGDEGFDVSVIDVATGAARRLAEKVEFPAQLSPTGRYATWFANGRWFTHDVRTRKTTDLTGALTGVRFDQETWDTPSTPAPWGLAGWTRDDRTLLLYSRFDVWEVDPAGLRAARSVTDSVGVQNTTVLRVTDLDPDDRFIDPSAPVILTAFNERTKQSGFMRDRLGVVSPPETLLMEDAAWRLLGKARRSDEMLLTRSTFREFPDLRVGTSVTQTVRISNVNPQQKDVTWGSNELVSWRAMDGQMLQGILFKPEGFDPSKQYPMVTYFYESLSDGLHSYVAPGGRNTINPTMYTSLGYLVFFPDIAYQEGYPGPSALKSIVPGIQSLIARGFVDPKRIGTAGQSWGGYQTAYMITQTNIFAAAFAGAPVANMTSAYGGIRWESGLARAFQYEKTQSRIGGSMWQYPLRFIENSPLFFTDRIATPVLIMANDADGAVPWYQGIEWFVALKRFGKEAYLLNYNNDGHNPRKRANQKDVDRRMQEFFGHHLKGEPKPEWMRSGIPYLEKGRDQLGPTAPASSAGAGREP